MLISTDIVRHIVTNHFLHFLTLDRSDPKKFQILQLIAALLGWNEGTRFNRPLKLDSNETILMPQLEQREQAGLARPGASNPSATSGRLRVPSNSVHRTPSTPTLTTDYMDNGTTSKESLAELWSNFLEQEAQAGSDAALRMNRVESPRPQ